MVGHAVPTPLNLTKTQGMDQSRHQWDHGSKALLATLLKKKTSSAQFEDSRQIVVPTQVVVEKGIRRKG
jgi:hypothetical protein